jgi:4-amino-4-deoxy-L-arabinose transferase-like glycosyltransferase
LPSSASTVLFRLAFASLLAYCAIGTCASIDASVRLIPNRWDNTYTESPTLYAATRATSTGALYHSLFRPPYEVQPYGPLFYLLHAGISAISRNDVDSTTRRGRVLAFGCYLLCGWLIYRISRRLDFARPSSAAAALLFLGQPALFGWNVSVRPDMLCSFLMLSCLAAAIPVGDAPLRAWIGSGALAGLACSIKQPGAAAPLAVVLALVRENKRREAGIFALCAAIPIALFYGAAWMREPFFVEQVTTAGKGPWSIANAALFVFRKLTDVTYLIPLAIGGLGIEAALRSNLRTRMVAYFALASAGTGLLTMPQLGANMNYFFPALASCGLLVPFVVQRVRDRIRSPGLIAAIMAVLICAIPNELQPWRYDPPRFVRAPDEAYAPLRSLRVLSDTPFVSLRARDPELLDPYFLHAMERTDHWSSSAVVEDVQRETYDLIVIACDREFICRYRGVAFFSLEVVQAINAHYAVLCADSGALVLEPRSRPPAVTPETLDPILGEPCSADLRGSVPNLVFPESAS